MWPWSSPGVISATFTTWKVLGLQSNPKASAHRGWDRREEELFCLGFVYKIVSSGLRVKNHFIFWSRCFLEQNARLTSRLGGVQSPGLPLLGSDCSPACCSPNPLLRYRLPFLPMHPTAFEDLLMRSLYACWPLERQHTQSSISQSLKSKSLCLVWLWRYFSLLLV